MRILLTNDDGVHARGLEYSREMPARCPTTSGWWRLNRSVRRLPFALAYRSAASARIGPRTSPSGYATDSVIMRAPHHPEPPDSSCPGSTGRNALRRTYSGARSQAH